MPRIDSIVPVFVDTMPHILLPGRLYISEKYSTTIHLCACGCGGKTVCPLMEDCWTLIRNGDLVTLNPSIGNWAYEDTHHAHYFIRNNQIIWA